MLPLKEITPLLSVSSAPQPAAPPVPLVNTGMCRPEAARVIARQLRPPIAPAVNTGTERPVLLQPHRLPAQANVLQATTTCPAPMSVCLMPIARFVNR